MGNKKYLIELDAVEITTIVESLLVYENALRIKGILSSNMDTKDVFENVQNMCRVTELSKKLYKHIEKDYASDIVRKELNNLRSELERFNKEKAENEQEESEAPNQA